MLVHILNQYFIHGELKPVASSDVNILFISKFPNSFLEKLTLQLDSEFNLSVSHSMNAQTAL